MTDSGSPHRGTTPPYLLRLLLQAAREAGVAEERLARLPGVESAGKVGIRLPSAVVMKIWETTGSAIDAWGGGTRVAGLWRRGDLYAWDYLWKSAPTLGGAVVAAARRLAAIRDPMESVAITEGEDGRVRVGYRVPFPDFPGAPLISELALGLILQEARAATGRRLTPESVRFAHRARGDRAHLIESFGTSGIDFGAGENAIVFDQADWSAPLPEADPTLFAIMEEFVETSIVTARPVLRWLDRVHGEIAEAFRQGGPTLERVARRLAMSPRTLQRRLHEEGTTWRDQLEHVRHLEGARLLRETGLGVDAIAVRVGYSDVRALRRTFRRVEGVTPSVYRSAERRH
ncbi:AraC family transcriptional regulator [Spongiactinospora sp. TRM90649]|uniref:AraC family transcriptional regulator n=1 Tax=Spongiactinospora sp. TRM90649 TaxID=3031114 RepID=UPI0023F7F696|nr:AraC family transcriptional regulator [Spongiactinospora sp. TRM90649]MDF5751487.1 helix-turn-helix domain-containing protein [Spongiactinospora sp. TRM90649]